MLLSFRGATLITIENKLLKLSLNLAAPQVQSRLRLDAIAKLELCKLVLIKSLSRNNLLI